MQDEINRKTVALSIRAGEKGAKMTEAMLKAAMRKFLNGRQRQVRTKPDHKVGKQNIKQLMKQNVGLSNIEVTDANIRSFERIANKYGIDYSLKKETGSEKPHYIVFFKARDVDVMTQAFKEYTDKSLNKDRKPSIKKKLAQFVEVSIKQQKNREKVKQKDRGMMR